MNLAIFNGSPRRHKSNSRILMEHFLSGYRSNKPEGNVQMAYLAEGKPWQEYLEIFWQASHVIIIFPLYTDCMPGIVKEFIEYLPKNTQSRQKSLGFIVQSGFPESIHSIYVEKYLHKLTFRLGYTYTGTVIKGGVEGIQVMPSSMTKKLYANFNKLGKHYATTGEFNPRIVKTLKGRLRMSKIKFLGFSLLTKTPLMNLYWDNNLKKNGAWKNRFDKPFKTTEN